MEKRRQNQTFTNGFYKSPTAGDTVSGSGVVAGRGVTNPTTASSTNVNGQMIPQAA